MYDSVYSSAFDFCDNRYFRSWLLGSLVGAKIKMAEEERKREKKEKKKKKKRN